MTKIKKEVIDYIKSKANIVDVVQRLGLQLKKKSVRYTCLCPFHEDHKLGNFIIYPKGNCYKCFSCGASGGVVQFVMDYMKVEFYDAIRILGNMYGIEVDDKDVEMKLPPAPPPPPPLPMLVLPHNMVEHTMKAETRMKDNLVKWICTGVCWDSLQLQRIRDVLNEYYVGTTRNGMTVFWEIDQDQQVRSGKMILYNQDGHRNKDKDVYNYDWIHASLFRQRGNEWNEKDYDVKHCLFGLHLLNKYPDAVVNIVESEKTAIFMAIAHGNNQQQVWMATGGLNNMTNERMRPLTFSNRRICLYPDRDAIDKWKVKAAQLNYSKVVINTKPVTSWWMPQDGEKADIADVVVRMINDNCKDKKTEVKPLIDYIT